MAGANLPEAPTNGAGRGIGPSEVESLSRKTINRKSVRSSSKITPKRSVKNAVKTLVGRAASKMFPTFSFQDSLAIADVIQAHAGGTGKIRRLTLFDAIKKSPDSGASRMLVTNSSRYGLTTGSYQAEHLELTPKGNLATNPEADPKEKLKARIELAIAG